MLVQQRAIASHNHGGDEEKDKRDSQQHRPGEEPLRDPSKAPASDKEPLGELAEGEHEGANTRVVLHGEAEVGVHMHTGEEVGVLALGQQPALSLQARGCGLEDLVELTELIEAHHTSNHGTAQHTKGDHKLPDHPARPKGAGISYIDKPEHCPRNQGMTLHSLQDARPLLASGDAAILEWWAGGGAFTLASAGAVRINFRGIHVHPPSMRLRALGGAWTGVPCNVSASALCCSDVGCVLPWAAPRLPEARDAVEAGWDKLWCSDAKGKVLVSLGVYDISACDIIDEGLDLLYTQGELYHRYTAMPLWRYWACVGLAIVLVRALSYNVQGLWNSNSADVTRPQWPALASALARLALLLPFDGDSVYVTCADQTFFWGSVAYVGYYLVAHGHSSGPRPVYNVIVAALQLLATRIYASAETPYNLVLLGMLACRVWTKVLTPRLHGGGLVVDSLYLSLCVELAYSGTREAMVGVIGVAFVAARLLRDEN